MFNNIIILCMFMLLCFILQDWLHHKVMSFDVLAQITYFSLSKYRHKAGAANSESILVSQLQHGLALEFEHSDPLRRLRLVLSELLAIMNKVTIYLCVSILCIGTCFFFKACYIFLYR